MQSIIIKKQPFTLGSSEVDIIEDLGATSQKNEIDKRLAFFVKTFLLPVSLSSNYGSFIGLIKSFLLWSLWFLTFIFLRWSLELSRSIGVGAVFAFVVANVSACYPWLLVYHVVDSFNLFFLSTKTAFWTLVAVINAIVEQLLVLFTIKGSFLERLMKLESI